jgi:hypothetical protein
MYCTPLSFKASTYEIFHIHLHRETNFLFLINQGKEQTPASKSQEFQKINEEALDMRWSCIHPPDMNSSGDTYSLVSNTDIAMETMTKM